VFGITGADGQAIVGPILSSDTETVTRELIHSTGVLSNSKVAWNTTVYGGALRNYLELPINDVRIPGVLGDMPAWFVPGKHNTWAILVHGATGTREQGLRSFQTLADLSLPILSITYRNDEGAPASSNGLSHLGDTEWQDLEASVKYALAQGAQHILLYGWSLGGTIVETFLDRSSYRSSIQATVLDSPILNWSATLDALAKKNSLPSFIARVTEKVISMRIGVHFNALNQVGQGQNQILTLLFHGISDTTAPIMVSDTFASTHSNITYHRIPEAEHTQCWNANPQVYETELRSFLTHVLDLMAI
jgi:predicted alpha/beta-fold hydrolase